MREFISALLAERECFSCSNHYTRYGIKYRLGVMKKEISVFNIPLIMSLGQHMIQTVVRSIPRACSCC